MVGEQNFDSLPSAEPPEPPFDDGHADVWAYRRGETLGGDETLSSVLSYDVERVSAINGHGVVRDPEFLEPEYPAHDNAVQKIRALGDQIRERKERLKSLGLTG